MALYAGIDVGSRTTKAVLIDGERTVATEILPTGSDPERTALRSFREALKRAKAGEGEVERVVATGYGRFRVSFADAEFTEITCHAKGAFFYFPGIRTVIDIGGQDAKVIALDEEGRVVDFVMNDKCAAGTGRFLEVMAQALEMDLEEMAEEAASATEGVSITSMCTVFAESEVISLIADGVERKKITRGIHMSIAKRILGMAKRLSVKKEVAFTGGVAKNKGMIKALEELLGDKLRIPPDPQLVGALGAALIASGK